MKVFSFKDRAEIERLIETVKSNPGAREAQRELARELTAMVHGSDQSEKVEAASSGTIETVNITANVFDPNYSDTNPITIDLSVTVIP